MSMKLLLAQFCGWPSLLHTLPKTPLTCRTLVQTDRNRPLCCCCEQKLKHPAALAATSFNSAVSKIQMLQKSRTATGSGKDWESRVYVPNKVLNTLDIEVRRRYAAIEPTQESSR